MDRIAKASNLAELAPLLKELKGNEAARKAYYDRKAALGGGAR